MAFCMQNYLVCHFGATYMDRKAGNPPFLFGNSRGDLIVKAYAKFDEVLTDGYCFNGLSVLGVKFVNEVPLWRHLYGRHDW